MKGNENLSETEIFFSALADKTRLRLLNLMRAGDELSVLSLVEVLDEGQPKISRHLAYLKSAEIVESRRDGKWIYYKIAAPKNDLTACVLRETLAWLGLQEKMRNEYAKLLNVYSSYGVSGNAPGREAPDISANANVPDKMPRREMEIFLL